MTIGTQTAVRAHGKAGRFQARLEQALGLPFTTGNRLRVLRNGDEIFPDMLRAIAAAQHTIEFLTFVYWTGDIAERFAAALAARARAGVEVRVLLDSFGAHKMPKHLVDQMTGADVEVRWFRPYSALHPSSWNHRTHRKILVCDGQVGFTGGVGIAKQWTGDARNPDEWRDTHFRFEGPSVAALRAAFWGNWIETTDGVPAALLEAAGADGAYPVGDATGPQSDGRQFDDAMVQIVRSTAAIGWNDVATVARVLIDSAEQRLAISTAYFSPDDLMTARLVGAIERGVDVSILIPGPHTDSRLPQLASAPQFTELLEHGVRISTFQPTMLHTKIMLIDDLVACIGSANFNQRSMRKDDEICAIVIGEAFTRLLADHMADDLKRAERIDPQAFARRGPYRRVKEMLTGLVKRAT